MSECIACYRDDVDAGPITPCGHIMCAQCATRWFERSLTCPMCRDVPVTMPSFDMDAPSKTTRASILKRVTMDAKDHVGITMSTFTRCGGRAARVLKVNENDKAEQCGIRPGDVVLSLNGIPITSHTQAVSICDRAAQSGTDVFFEIETLSGKRRLYTTCVNCLHAVGNVVRRCSGFRYSTTF